MTTSANVVEERYQGCRVLTLYGRTHLELSCFVGERLQTFIASPGPLSQHHTPSLHFLFGEERALAPHSGSESGFKLILQLPILLLSLLLQPRVTPVKNQQRVVFEPSAFTAKGGLALTVMRVSMTNPCSLSATPHAPHSPEAAVTQCSLHFHLGWEVLLGVSGHYWQSQRDFIWNLKNCTFTF